MIYFAIRVAVASSIMIAFYVTRGFGSKVETFVMAFGAALVAQGVAFAVKLAVGDQARNRRAAALLLGCVVMVAASVVFVAIDKSGIDAKQSVHGYLDMSTLRRTGDTAEFTIVEAGKRTQIRYRGALSDQMRDRNEIVAKGQWKGDVFVATDVLAKCPTTYPSPNGPVPASQYR
jgi:cytochrome c-type biogenesis CcmE protein